MLSVLELPIPSVRRAYRYLAFGLLASSLWLSEAHAREHDVTPEQRTEAKRLVAEASSAFEAGQFEQALTLFDRAAQIVEAPTIALMQARTLVELGRLVAAADRYAAAQRVDPSDVDNVAFQNAAVEAKSESELLTPRIPILRVKLLGSNPEQAEVTIDGRRVAPNAVTKDQRLDPGVHTVLVKTPAGASSTRSVTLVERAREELVFSLEPVVRVPAPERAPAPPRDEEPKKPRVAGWVTLGAGVAFTGAGAVLGALALGHQADLNEVCDPGCPPDYADELDAFRIERTLSYVGFGLGAAGIGTGLYLLLRDEPGRATAALGLSPTGVRLSGRFQ